MTKFLRRFTGCGAVLVSVLAFSTCSYIEPPPSQGNTETVFFVALNDSAVRGTYEVIRLTLIDAEGTQLALGTGPIEGKYNLTLPLSAINETNKINFLVELKTQELLSDKIQTLAPNAMARGYLRSRYTQIVHNSIPTSGETITLNLNNDDLKVGYGPGQLSISDIPLIPDFFKINLVVTNIGIEPLLTQGYTAALAVAIDTPVNSSLLGYDDPGLRFNLANMPPINEADILGIASPDTGWYMIMEDEINPNQPCRYWVFFTKDNDYTTSHLYYHTGTIPNLGSVVNIEPDFAGIPIPDETTLKMLALKDADRSALVANGLPFDISDLSESFVLTSPNYDLSGDFWLPIGRDINNHPNGDGYSPFTGVFDGGGYTIWSINLTGTINYSDYGFFGNVKNAKLQNFNFYVDEETLTFNPIITAENTYAGILAGYTLNTELKNISVSGGPFSANRSGSAIHYVGGVVGRLQGTEANVSAAILVTANGGGTIWVNEKYGKHN